VLVTAGVLSGLRGVVRRFGSLGNPVSAIDGFFEVMVGVKVVKVTS
jgi:hypothetical protein